MKKGFIVAGIVLGVGLVFGAGSLVEKAEEKSNKGESK